MNASMTAHTRSVKFSPTSQLILYDDNIDTEGSSWYSKEEEDEFKMTMVEDVKRLREAFVTSKPPRLSKDDLLVDCTGIEVHVLLSEDTRQRLHDMKRVYRRIVVTTQHLFSPLEFSQVLQQGSEDARQRALKLAALSL